MASSNTMPTSPALSLISTSFRRLRSNPTQSLPLLFLSLLPSSLSPFSSYLPINPVLIESFSFPYRPTYVKIFDYSIYHLTINCTTKLISTIFFCFFLSFIPLAPTLRTLYLVTTSTVTSKSHLKATLSIFSARLCVVALDLTYKCLLIMLLYLELRYLPSVSVLSLSTVLFGSFFGEFLRQVWVLSLVAAVVEEDRCCGGVAAVRRAVELVVDGNGGKYSWMHVVGLSAYLFLCSDLVIYQCYDLALFYVSSGGVDRTVLEVVLVAAVAAMSLLSLAAQVELYCGLKKSSEEEGDYANLTADDPIRVNVIDD